MIKKMMIIAVDEHRRWTDGKKWKKETDRNKNAVNEWAKMKKGK